MYFNVLSCSLVTVCLLQPAGVLGQSSKATADTAETNTLLPRVIAYNANRALLSRSKTHHQLIELDKKVIRTAGNTDLSEVLEMQVGIVNLAGSSQSPFGTGIQMMGLSEGYIQLLENGQPLIGRNAGVLGVSRIPSFSIQKLEVIKGTMAGLYGNSALGGIINVITIPPYTNTIPLQTEITANTVGRYNLDIASSWKAGRRSTLTLLASGGIRDGYKKSEETGSYASDPQQNASATLHWVCRPTSSQQLRLSVKGYYTHLKGPVETNEISHSQNTIQWDYNATAEYKIQLSKKIYFQTNIYYAAYKNAYTLQPDKSAQLTDSQVVSQSLWMPTIALKWNNFRNGHLYAGSDLDIQRLSSTRYTDDHTISNYAMFVQQEWSPANWVITAGVRADLPDGYETRLSPQIGIRYQHKKWTFSASIGQGYKIPDFRQRFLFFPHSAVGYILIGREVLRETLLNYVDISEKIDKNNFENTVKSNKLQAETSLSFQLGTTYQINNHHTISVWLFRNDITNLIETYTLPFQSTQQYTIYSYRNVQSIYTQGIDVRYQAYIRKHRLSFSYHFLHTADKEVERKVKQGKVYARDAKGEGYRVQPSEYRGLFLRPAHMVTLAAEGPINGWFHYQLQLRIQARMGWSDQNGSIYLDGENEYANDLHTINASIYKKFETPQCSYRVQLGVKNILNERYPTYYPSVLGINAYIKFYFQLN